MTKIFNYSHLCAQLEKSTRTLVVTLNRNDLQHTLNLELLFEIESLLSWTQPKVEITSVLFKSSSAFFSPGFCEEKLPHYSSSQIIKIQNKIFQLIQFMHQMPQTIIFDLQKGAKNWALELSLGADIRMAHQEGEFSFNHQLFGLIPASGGISFLRQIVPMSFAQKWIASAESISYEDQNRSGFIHYHYDAMTKESCSQKVLNNIFKQSSVARIQSKLALTETFIQKIEEDHKQDTKISKAVLMTEDWKTKTKNDDESFMPAKSFGYAVKLSLVKNEFGENADNNLPHQ